MSSPVSASTRYDSDEDEYEDDYDIESVEAISVGAASSDSDATIHDIPRLTLTTIHHPCVIHNLDKAVLSLGGPHALNRVSYPHSTQPSDRTRHHTHIGLGLPPYGRPSF